MAIGHAVPVCGEFGGRAVEGAGGFVGTTFCPIFSLPILFLEMRGAKGPAFALASTAKLSKDVCQVSLLSEPEWMQASAEKWPVV